MDFSIIEKQDVFIYIKGQSIMPSGSFQQTTRTRNINNLYYFCNNCKSNNAKYSSLNDVIDKYVNISNLNNKLNNICLSLNENDNEIVVKNSYFNIFCYNEYVNDIYKTNKLIHYQNILIQNGFNLFDENDIEKSLSK